MLKRFRPNTQRPQNEAALAIIASCLDSRGSHRDEEGRTAEALLPHADRRPGPPLRRAARRRRHREARFR
eukprot:11092155-Heterocapsa_arctica.AAC.1